MCVTLFLMDTQLGHVGAEIRQAREARGMSRRRAAQVAGVSEARMRQIENGVQYRDGVATPVSTTPETLARIASAVGLDIGHVFEEAGFDAAIAENMTPEQLARTQKVGRAHNRGNTRILNLDEFPQREAELIDAFVLGLELNRPKTQ